MRYLLIGFLFLAACLNGDLLQLASKYGSTVVFLDSVQQRLRLINSECKYEKKCFKAEGKKYVEKTLCPDFKKYGFVSELECKKSGEELILIVSGEKSLGVPVKNPAQDWHNDRMYELEKKKLKRDKKARDREDNERWGREARDRRERDREERDRLARRNQCQTFCGKAELECRTGCRGQINNDSSYLGCRATCREKYNTCASSCLAI